MPYNQDPRLSTFYNRNSSLATHQPFTPIEDTQTGTVEYYVDMLDHRLWNAIANIQSFTMERYDGAQLLTTLAHRKYGKTGYWFAIIAYNGLVHELEIEPGTLLRLPNQAALEEVLQKYRKPVSSASAGGGQRVRI